MAVFIFVIYFPLNTEKKKLKRRKYRNTNAEAYVRAATRQKKPKKKNL